MDGLTKKLIISLDVEFFKGSPPFKEGTLQTAAKRGLQRGWLAADIYSETYTWNVRLAYLIVWYVRMLTWLFTSSENNDGLH